MGVESAFNRKEVRAQSMFRDECHEDAESRIAGQFPWRCLFELQTPNRKKEKKQKRKKKKRKKKKKIGIMS